jgi:DNA polymerase IV
LSLLELPESVQGQVEQGALAPSVATEIANRLGIHTGADLRGRDESELVRLFGRVGRYYYRIARGIDERPVSPHRIRKSLGAERTFAQDLGSIDTMHAALRSLTGDVGEGLARRRLVARTITLKVRYRDFQTVTRSHTVTWPGES